MNLNFKDNDLKPSGKQKEGVSLRKVRRTPFNISIIQLQIVSLLVKEKRKIPASYCLNV